MMTLNDAMCGGSGVREKQCTCVVDVCFCGE